jgi:hypothetical protein
MWILISDFLCPEIVSKLKEVLRNKKMFACAVDISDKWAASVNKTRKNFFNKLPFTRNEILLNRALTSMYGIFEINTGNSGLVYCIIIQTFVTGVVLVNTSEGEIFKNMIGNP